MKTKQLLPLKTVHGGEVYYFIVAEDQYPELARRLGLFVANPELNFDWPDAAKILKQFVERTQSELCCGRNRAWPRQG